MAKASKKKQRFPFNLLSLLLAVASFLTMGFVIPPLFTLPLGITTGVLAVKRNSSWAGLILNVAAFIVYLALIIFWYELSRGFQW